MPGGCDEGPFALGTIVLHFLRRVILGSLPYGCLEFRFKRLPCAGLGVRVRDAGLRVSLYNYGSRLSDERISSGRTVGNSV